MHSNLILSPTAAILAVLSTGGGIEWSPDYPQALIRAAQEQRVVFIAVNMDGESANERMLSEVYRDQAVAKLAGETVNLIASVSEHEREGECPRFGTITCREHRAIDIDVRGKVLRPDADGYVVAPQHVFLNPEGEVLLSVPYEITAGELEWCLAEAQRRVDPTHPCKLSKNARAPRRLILGGVYAAGAGESRPPSRDEVLALLDTLKRGTLRGPERMDAIRRVLLSDEIEALEFALSELRRGQGAGRGAGGRAGGGGAGLQPEREGQDPRTRLLRWIGARSPVAYQEIAAEALKHADEAIRKEAAVALEQLASPASTKALLKAYSKEKSPAALKNILRALGATGSDDARAVKLVLKQARSKDDLLRLNAIVALGSMTSNESVRASLVSTLESEQVDARIAALCAVATSRDPRWLESLRSMLAAEESLDQRVEKTCETAIEVLTKGDAKPIRGALMEITRDEIPRERIFGRP